MKCDELKDMWFNAYPEIMGIEGGEPTKCYGKAEVDEAIAELKDDNRKLKRALWMARAYRGYDNSILLPSKFMRKVWDYVERKCRAKAEQYK